jgi:hypothetical protein
MRPSGILFSVLAIWVVSWSVLLLAAWAIKEVLS